MKTIKGNFWVGNFPMANWFNLYFRPKQSSLFPHEINSLGFGDFMNAFSELTGKSEVELKEAIAFIMLPYMETGGRYDSPVEMGSPQYMFEPNDKGKVSYNKANGNIPCGTTLRLSGAKLSAWNGIIFPNDEYAQDSEECDYWKFRGRLRIQLTGRDNYKKYAESIIGNLDKLSSKQIDKLLLNPKIGNKITQKYIYQNPASGKALQAIQNGDFRPFGRLIAGYANEGYAENYHNRCVALLNALEKEKITHSDLLLPNQRLIVRSVLIGTVVGVVAGLGYVAVKKIKNGN